MSFSLRGGRPSLSGTHGSRRSSLESPPPDVDLAQLRLMLLSTRELPCFQTRPECQAMINDVLNSVLPIAAMAEAFSGTSIEPTTLPHTDATTGLTLPPAVAVSNDMSIDHVGASDVSVDRAACLSSFATVSGSGAPDAGGMSSAPASTALKRRGSMATERSGINRIPDRAWTIALDYLELGEGMRCRQLGRAFRDTVEASLSVLALSGVNTITWATPDNLSFLTRFRNVRTLHWYVGVGMPSKEESAAAAAETGDNVGSDLDGGQLVPGERFGAAAGESFLRVADCSPVRAWAYLLGALPKVEEVIIVEGAETDEMALEEVWLHLLPLCRNLRSFFLNFEDYSQCPVDGDHPPINVKKFAVFLQAKKPFPKLRELHLELGSMSIAEQRSLIRGLSMSGLLPQLEKVTLGDGTTSYVRSPGRGPGRDLYTAFKKNVCSKLKVLWLQRLDLWDDLEALASALGPEYCPVMEELFLDLALDTDDVQRLASFLHRFPPCLKTLGVLAVAIKDRTSEGAYTNVDPTPALQKLADALALHPRPKLQCLDVSLHFEPDTPEEPIVQPEVRPSFRARMAALPIMELLKSGKLTGLKHVQLSSCSLDDKGLLAACQAVAGMKGIKTLDLSTNKLTKAGAAPLAKSLGQCHSLHEIVLEESVQPEDMISVSAVFKEFMPWATVRVEDRDTRRGNARRSQEEVGQPFDADVDVDDQGNFDDADGSEDGADPEDDDGEDGQNHWDGFDHESDGEVPAELMVDDSDEDEDM